MVIRSSPRGTVLPGISAGKWVAGAASPNIRMGVIAAVVEISIGERSYDAEDFATGRSG